MSIREADFESFRLFQPHHHQNSPTTSLLKAKLNQKTIAATKTVLSKTLVVTEFGKVVYVKICSKAVAAITKTSIAPKAAARRKK